MDDKRLILVIEDQHAVKELIFKRLIQEGYHAMWARHGGVGMKIMRQEIAKRFGAIILDQEMVEWDQQEPPQRVDPEAMDGDEFLKQCLAEKINLSPIILHTASADSFFRQMHTELGIKPGDYTTRAGLPRTNLELKNEESGLHIFTVDKTSPHGLDRVIEILDSLGLKPQRRAEVLEKDVPHSAGGMNKKAQNRTGRPRG